MVLSLGERRYHNGPLPWWERVGVRGVRVLSIVV